MIKYNSTIINPKNIDFVKTFLGSTVQVFFANGEKCEIHTQSTEEAEKLIDKIYKDMNHSWECELRTR